MTPEQLTTEIVGGIAQALRALAEDPTRLRNACMDEALERDPKLTDAQLASVALSAEVSIAELEGRLLAALRVCDGLPGVVQAAAAAYQPGVDKVIEVLRAKAKAAK